MSYQANNLRVKKLRKPRDVAANVGHVEYLMSISFNLQTLG